MGKPWHGTSVSALLKANQWAVVAPTHQSGQESPTIGDHSMWVGGGTLLIGSYPAVVMCLCLSLPLSSWGNVCVCLSAGSPPGHYLLMLS